MDTPGALTLEQQFQLQAKRAELATMTLDQLHDEVVAMLLATMVQANAHRELIRAGG